MERHRGVEKVRRRVEEAEGGERRDGAGEPCREAGGAAVYGGDGEKGLEKAGDLVEVVKVEY